LHFDTLTLYLVAAGLSLSLGLVLVGFQALRPQAVAARQSALAILMLAVGFFGAGFGPSLPRWATVIGTNMILIAAGVVLHGAFVALAKQRTRNLDTFGWGVVALTALPFWYWGLVEPNGHYRSVVFSLAVLAINGRTALALTASVRQSARKQWAFPMGFLALLFASLSLWMLGRALLLVLTEAPVAARGANPTTWVTVFWYVVLISAMTMTTLWLETLRLRDYANGFGQTHAPDPLHAGVLGLTETMRGKLILLWSVMLVVALGTVGELGVTYARLYDIEKVRLIKNTELTNDAFVEHSIQIVSQVDAMLNAVRHFYTHTRSLRETEEFIDALHFNHTVIDNIYLISASGQIVIAHDPNAIGLSVADRGYFQYLRTHATDDMFISPVEAGRVTTKLHFRITRRISAADGGFDGLVLATVNPQALATYYQQLGKGFDAVASLVNVNDKMLRARAPEPPPDQWQVPIDSPIWQALANASSGIYENTSQIDGIERLFAYKTVGATPLVMVTGASYTQLQVKVWEQIRWIAASALAIAAILLILAGLLTLEIRHRSEQDRFLSMLSHELKTPLSVIQMTLSSLAAPAESKSRLLRAIADVVAIVDRSLQADRLQRRRVQVVAAPCQVASVVADVVAGCPAPERITVTAPALPTCTTDTQLLRVVLSNLIDNALKYAAPGSQIDLTAGTDTHLGQAGFRVDVSNIPGPAGLPDAKQVFKKYYRSAGAQGKSGSGLGLYIASGMARVLRGHLRYQNSVGMVRFSLWIPL
jgi:signal transduction histidine kinase